MDILEAFGELFAGLIIFSISFFVIMDFMIDPAFEQIEINYNARADKAATFTTSINEGLGIHDQKVGRTPGVDPDSGYTRNDSGSSRMYFRSEQFVMLPAVDTDIASNPNVDIYTRTNAISSIPFKEVGGDSKNTSDIVGLEIGKDTFLYTNSYKIDRDSLYDKQITYESIKDDNMLTNVDKHVVYPSVLFGTQTSSSKQPFGGFNITLDSSVHPTSGKPSNSVIFLSGRMPTK